MKVMFVALLMLAVSSVASAQSFIAGAGYLQGGSAASSSGVSGAGGSGAAIAGISGTQTTAASSNLSGTVIKQVPGGTSVVTESVSNGGMQSTSGALGLAAAGSTSNFGANGTASGLGGQGALIGFSFP